MYILGTDVINKSPSFVLFLYSDNIISLNIYFDDLSYDEIEQIPVFETWTLACKYFFKACQSLLQDQPSSERSESREIMKMNELFTVTVAKFQMQAVFC